MVAASEKQLQYERWKLIIESVSRAQCKAQTGSAKIEVQTGKRQRKMESVIGVKHKLEALLFSFFALPFSFENGSAK